MHTVWAQQNIKSPFPESAGGNISPQSHPLNRAMMSTEPTLCPLVFNNKIILL